MAYSHNSQSDPLKVSIIPILKPTNGFLSQDKSQSSYMVSTRPCVSRPHPCHLWLCVQWLYFSFSHQSVLPFSPVRLACFCLRMFALLSCLECSLYLLGSHYHFFRSVLKSHFITKVVPLRTLCKWNATTLSSLLYFSYTVCYIILLYILFIGYLPLERKFCVPY